MSCIIAFRRTIRGSAFSLVELVIVVVIVGIIAAIAVPRFTSASQGADASALAANLTSVRSAIEYYYAEHGKYPGYNPAGGGPSAEHFVRQLTEYTDSKGNPSTKPGSPYFYGPYLRKPFPQNPFNGKSEVHVRKAAGDATPAAGSTGWIATLSTGDFDVSATVEQATEISANAKGNAKAVIGKGG